jgi:protein-disulfide isomerase
MIHMSPAIPPFDIRCDYFQGEPSADIELIEYGDFLCGYCCRVYPEIKYLRDALGNQFRFIYRNLPSPEQHPLAIPAMIAAEAAGRQGKFWYMHDMIFENQAFLRPASFRKFALNIGMDVCQFDKDIQDPMILNKIKSDLLSSFLTEMKKTPGFFINGKRFHDFPDFTSLLAACFHLLDTSDLRCEFQLK